MGSEYYRVVVETSKLKTRKPEGHKSECSNLNCGELHAVLLFFMWQIGCWEESRESKVPKRRWVDDTCVVSTKFNNSYNASPYQRNTHLPALFDLLPFLTRNRVIDLEFGATDCLAVATLGLIEIDDVPNGIEILADHRFRERMGRTKRRAKDLRRPLR